MTHEYGELAPLVPSGQELLASCFDAHHTMGGGLFSFGGGEPEIDRLSSSGLCVGDSELHRVLWSDAGSPAELLTYDERGVKRYHRLDGVATPHDIMIDGDRIVVVATTQNCVLWIAPDGTVTRRWQPPGEEDSWHLNSVTQHRGRVAVCAFGRYERRRGWDAAGRPATGCLVDVDSGETLLAGLKAPHNPVLVDGSWLVCNSGEGELLEITEDGGTVRRRLALPGWPRGLAVSDRHLFVGLSSHRHAVTSVGSASVVAVDRATWQPVARVALPAREVYALALVPASLAAGVRTGFAANHSREQEQGQRRMFDLAGVRPRSLWVTGDLLPDADCRVDVSLSGPAPTTVTAGELLAVECGVTNRGTALLSGTPPYPVLVTHRWYDADGRLVETEPLRTRLPRALPPGESIGLGIRARVPAEPGAYRLRVTLTQRGGREFDRVDPANAVDIGVTVTAGGAAAGPPAYPELGLTPGAFAAAALMLAGQGDLRSATRALLTHPAGRCNGMVAAFCAERGVPAFAERVADTLGLAATEVAEAVRDLLPAPDEVMLTGAEAVALAMRGAGARRAFAYAGTSELALCDAFARLGPGFLVNGRGDTESLFQAGGASRITPGTAVAVLHGARGLTNALGALADLRRNEVGTVVVVGLPSTASASFLPPHGESELISSAGAFAKSWYELAAVPAEPAARAAAVARFQRVVAEAVALVGTRPYGPVLIGIPQDVAEAAWVPLAALDGLPDAGRPPGPETGPEVGRPPGLAAGPGQPGGADLPRAAELIGAAQRVAVLVDDYALSAPGFEAALARFTGRIGAPVLQVKYRRGPMLFQRIDSGAVPAFLGWYEPSDAGHQMIMNGADLLLTIEDRNMFPRVIGPLPNCRKVALTSHPAATVKNGYLGADDLLLHADPVAALDALTALVPAGDRTEPWYAPWSRPVPRAYQPPPAAAELRAGLVRAIGRRLGERPGAVLLDDSQMFGGLIAEEYDLLPPGLRVFGDHGAFVGGGIASAVGVALGEPGTRVLCCVGDQGFTNGLQGLVAARQENADVTFLVCNNGGSVSLRRQAGASAALLDAGRHHYLANSDGLRYTDLAEATGVPAWRVDLVTGPAGQREQMELGLHRFETVLGNALATPGPALIELVLPADQRFWTGVWITEGLEAPSVAALLFDLDGVLVDSHDSIEQAWRRWARRRGVSWELLREQIPGRRAVETIRAVLPDLPAEQVRADAAEVNREQTEDTSTIVEVAGMRRLVEKAIAEGLPWAVVTGCPRALARARLDAAGYPEPEVLVTAEDVAVGKPAPDGYLLAAKILGVPAGRCVVLEDAASGVAAGRAAGAAVIGVRTSPREDLGGADLVIADAVGLNWPLDLARTRA